MTVFPGDTVGRFKIDRLVAYQGNPDCTYAGCTRRGSFMRTDGTWHPGECYGWHCSLCDAPTSMMGHKCPRAADVQDGA